MSQALSRCLEGLQKVFALVKLVDLQRGREKFNSKLNKHVKNIVCQKVMSTMRKRSQVVLSGIRSGSDGGGGDYNFKLGHQDTPY